jgi:hypothetical protein
VAWRSGTLQVKSYEGNVEDLGLDFTATGAHGAGQMQQGCC